MNENELHLAGIDLEDLLKRLMGNAALIRLLVQRFEEDTSYKALEDAAKAGDAKAMETASHTLKGMCGNMSLKALFELFAHQVQLLRAGDLAGAQAMMADIRREYGGTITHMRLWLVR